VLEDIAVENLNAGNLPESPEGMEITRIDVLARLASKGKR
jgi:hypothetical protein